jgi:putative tricarboxylic transport membrane protein
MIEAFLSVLVGVLADPSRLALILFSTLAGIVLGALPGISSTMALAVLLPFSFAMGAQTAIFFLMGIFYGSVYGGSVSAILLNIPGTPGSMVTQLDGYPMARKGRAGEALTFALAASTFGGVFGLVALVIFAPLLASAALAFQSPEYAVIMVFGLSMLAYASPGSTFLAILAGIIGLIIGTVGLDPVTNFARLDFDVPRLMGGINLIPVVVGLFGFAEILRLLEQTPPPGQSVGRIGRIFPNWRDLRGTVTTAVRSSFFGVLVGIIPAAGSAVAVSVAYAQEKRLYKDKETFGDGNPRGVVAAEAGNNACVGGALTPMMTLGIPGDTMTAVLIGALLIHGLRPGPELFTQNPEFVATVYVALLLAILATLIWALIAMRGFARVLSAPPRVLLTLILMLCVVGSYSVQNSTFDILVMICAGVVGYLMNKVGMPTAPIVFGLVLGPILEENLRRSLIVYRDWSIFIQRPISATLLAISALVLLYPPVAFLRETLSRRRAARGGR